MNRRKFLGNTALFSVPLMLQGVSVFAGNGLSSPFLQSLADIASSCGKVLVIIQLNGGNDGLNMVIPIDRYAQLSTARPDILIPQSALAATTISPTTALHPDMTGLKNMYNDGKVCIVQGVSYPNPNFSHFQAQDIWFTGSTALPSPSTGWLGRQLDVANPGFPTGYPTQETPDPLSIQIGGSLPLMLQGPNINMAYNAPNPASLISVATAVPASAPQSDYGTELTFLRLMKSQSNAYTTRISTAYNAQATLSTMYRGNTEADRELETQLKVVARLIGGGLQTPVYVVNHPLGFDTHADQVSTNNNATGYHARALKILSDAIAAFQNDITLMGKADKVTGMTFSEFGRRVINNGSKGTDHGSGAPVIFFGAKVNAGIIGSSPVLPAVSNGNTQVPLQHDYRQLYASIMQQWLCMTPTQSQSILSGTYSTIPIFNTPPPLPITGTELLARWINDYAQLEFEVFENDSYEKFIVERSVNGRAFSYINTIANVSLNTQEKYTYKDNRINASEVYYRIKAISKQGEVSYSKIAILRNVGKQNLTVYPNPVTNHTINVEFFSIIQEEVTFTIIGTLGEKLYFNKINPNGRKVITFKVPNYFATNTLYMLNIQYGDIVVNEKIVFQ
jgi:uncharacterized protein (DUF1501 family)